MDGLIEAASVFAVISPLVSAASSVASGAPPLGLKNTAVVGAVATVGAVAASQQLLRQQTSALKLALNQLGLKFGGPIDSQESQDFRGHDVADLAALARGGVRWDWLSPDEAHVSAASAF